MEQIMLTPEQREQSIKTMLKLLNKLMIECDQKQIRWSDLVEIAEHTWAVNNNKESWSCGSKEDHETLEQMVK